LRQYSSLVNRLNEKDEKEEYRIAGMKAHIANIHRDKKVKSTPYQPKDFLPDLLKRKSKPSPEELLQKAKNINAALGCTRNKN